MLKNSNDYLNRHERTWLNFYQGIFRNHGETVSAGCPIFCAFVVNVYKNNQVDMTDPNEVKKLDAGFALVLIIWGAIFASLGVYLGICLGLGHKLPAAMHDGFSLAALRYVLFGISVATLVAVYFLRDFMLTHPGFVGTSRPVPPTQHPAVARYTVIVIITSALLESIGLYGLILFFIAKDSLSLYQLLGLSAAAMLFYRPKKEDLLALAERMKISP